MYDFLHGDNSKWEISPGLADYIDVKHLDLTRRQQPETYGRTDSNFQIHRVELLLRKLSTSGKSGTVMPTIFNEPLLVSNTVASFDRTPWKK